MGVPLPTGHPVTIVPNLPENLDLAILRSIQTDNFKFIRHMIMAGWKPTNPTACGFSITINKYGVQEQWQVTQATPLHYAVCCASLQAATAILIAFPALASLSCKVTSSASDFPQSSRWTTLDLTSFFGNLYKSVDQPRHKAYEQASLVLLQMALDPPCLSFMQQLTPRERLSHAGGDWDELAAGLLSPVPRS